MGGQGGFPGQGFKGGGGGGVKFIIVVPKMTKNIENGVMFSFYGVPPTVGVRTEKTELFLGCPGHKLGQNAKNGFSGFQGPFQAKQPPTQFDCR